jgi:hypothetical protein
LRIDDVLGVWPLHGLCGAWGGIAAGIFSTAALGGLGGVALGSQIAGTLCGIVVALAGGAIAYGSLKATVGLRLDEEEEFIGFGPVDPPDSGDAERLTDQRPQRSASGETFAASASSPRRLCGCSGASGWRTASEAMTPPSFITTFVARNPHCRFS